MKHTESAEQRLFVQRLRMDARTKHVLFTAVPLGGYRNPREAARLKAEGANAGCPDLLIFDQRDRINTRPPAVGLALEFKAGKNKPTLLQCTWHVELRARGWEVQVVYSADEAWCVTCFYLGITP